MVQLFAGWTKTNFYLHPGVHFYGDGQNSTMLRLAIRRTLERLKSSRACLVSRRRLFQQVLSRRAPDHSAHFAGRRRRDLQRRLSGRTISFLATITQMTLSL